MRWREAITALLWLALLAGPARAELGITDDRGVTVTLARPAQRIVTLSPALTETVCALRACQKLVATDRYSNWPASVQALPKAGGLEDLNVERIVALKPDLVLAASSIRALDRLRSLGLTVAALEPKTHADLHRVMLAVGTLAGSPQAEDLWQKLQAQTRAAAARVPAGWRGRRVYFEVDEGPYAAGPGSFIGETMRQLGLANIVPADQGPFPRLNPEFVVREQPDVIVAGHRELEAMAARPGWSALRALKEKRTCSFERDQADMLVRAGPRLGEAAGLLADCLAHLEPPK